MASWKQILVAIGDRDEDLYVALDAYCQATGASKSEAIKRCMKAVLLGDEKAVAAMRSFPTPAALEPARLEPVYG